MEDVWPWWMITELKGWEKCWIKWIKDFAWDERGQSPIISGADEDDILRTNTQDKLRDTLLFLLGLNFAVRIGAEHYNLRYRKNSQLKLGKEKDSGQEFLEYTEDVSKYNSGWIHHMRLKRKQTNAYHNLETPNLCVVSVFKKYFRYF